jgi:lambda repressor-like predicted transcriptional regulator
MGVGPIVEVPEELIQAEGRARAEDRLAELYERHAPAAGRLLAEAYQSRPWSPWPSRFIAIMTR